MSAVRSLMVAVGVALTLLAAALLVAPLPAAVVPDDTLVVVGFFTVAFTVSVSVWTLSGVRRSDPSTPPRVESAAGGDHPGAAFDASVDRWPAVSLSQDRREAIRDRLRETAVRTLMREGNRRGAGDRSRTGYLSREGNRSQGGDHSRDDARERVRRGTWTDDPIAADFLRPEHASGVGALRRRLRFRRDVRRTVEAIEAITDEEAP